MSPHRKAFRFPRETDGNRHGYSRYERLLGKLRAVLSQDEQPPLDLVQRCLDVGIDVSAVELGMG